MAEAKIHTQHDKPLGLLDTVVIGLGITEGGNVNLVGLGNLVGGTVTDEDGLTTPLDDDLWVGREEVRLASAGMAGGEIQDVRAYVLALGDGVKVDLDLGHGQNVGRGGHVDEELYCDDTSVSISLSTAIGCLINSFP